MRNNTSSGLNTTTYAIIALLFLGMMVVDPGITDAQFPGSATGVGAFASNPGTPPQTIASTSYSPVPGTCPTGTTGATCATVAVVMSPVSPAFNSQGNGGIALVGSGGSCSGGDTTHFGVSGLNVTLSNASTAAATYPLCVQVFQANISNSPQYQSASINVTTNTGPPVPAGAQAAGFTTLAMNMDFTGATTSSFKGTTFNINNVYGSNGWLYCYQSTPPGGNPTNPIWWLTPSWSGAAPCSDVSLIYDSVSGTNVLNELWQTTDPANYNNGGTEIDTWQVNEQGNGYDFPMGDMYFEIAMRTDSTTLGSCPGNGNPAQCAFYDVWAWPTSSGTEWDFLELAINGNPYGYSACHGDANCGTSGQIYPSSWSSYNVFGYRFTSDGTNMAECAYLNNAFQDCGPNFTAADGTQTTEGRSFLRIQTGPGQFLPLSYNPTANNNSYIQYVRVWSCSSWQTGPCLRSVLAGSP